MCGPGATVGVCGVLKKPKKTYGEGPGFAEEAWRERKEAGGKGVRISTEAADGEPGGEKVSYEKKRDERLNIDDTCVVRGTTCGCGFQ